MCVCVFQLRQGGDGDNFQTVKMIRFELNVPKTRRGFGCRCWNRALAVISAPRVDETRRLLRARMRAQAPACAPLAALTSRLFCVRACLCAATLEVIPHVAVGSGEQAALSAGVGAAQGGRQREHHRPAAAPRPRRPQRPSLHLLQPRR